MLFRKESSKGNLYGNCTTHVLQGTFGFRKGNLNIDIENESYKKDCVIVSNGSMFLKLGFLRRGMQIKGFIGCQATDEEFLRFKHVNGGTIILPGPIKIKGLNSSGYRIFNNRTQKEVINTIGYLARYHNVSEIVYDFTKGEAPINFYRNDLNLELSEDGDYILEITNNTICKLQLYFGKEPSFTLVEEDEISVPIRSNISSFCITIEEVNVPNCFNLSRINGSSVATNKLQLHAFDYTGRHVGFDYTNCTFKNVSGGWEGVNYTWLKKECEYENELKSEVFKPEIPSYIWGDSLCFLRNFTGYLVVSTEGLGDLKHCSYIFKILIKEYWDGLCKNESLCKLYKFSMEKELKYFYINATSIKKIINIMYT